MIRFSPVWRISVGLVFMSAALVLSGDFLFDLSAGRSANLFNERKKLIEVLALGYSSLALQGQTEAMMAKMNALINGDDQIASCALKRADNRIVVQSGDHQKHWDPPPVGTSTLSNIRVPIYQGEVRWGTLEVSFASHGPFGEILFLANPLIKLLLFIFIMGLISYFLFMKRVLKHLDPSAVVPERVKTAMNILTEGVMFLNEKGQIVLANAALAEKMGVATESLLGRKVNNFQWLDPKTEQPHQGFPYLKKLLAGQPIRRQSLALKSPDNKVHKLVVNASAIKDPKGALRGALISMDDVTLLEKSNQRLLRMTKQLEQLNIDLEKMVEERTARITKTNLALQEEIIERKRAEEHALNSMRIADIANSAKSDFLANMSHELRTPLNHIIGFTELVTDEHFGELNPQQKEYLEDSLGSSHHLLSLINDILDLSKVEAGKMELQPEQIELPGLINNSIIMIKEKALKEQITVKTDLDGLPATVYADRRKLKQVMYNLLSNAVKFTPEKGTIEIAGSLHIVKGQFIRTADGREIPISTNNGKNGSKDHNFAQITIKDSGIGLKPDNLERIFGSFDQVETSKSRQYQGTGLGLALTKKMVELHGGAIWAESKGEDHGATFTLIIPVAARV